jgi:hypothetical protein
MENVVAEQHQNSDQPRSNEHIQQRSGTLKRYQRFVFHVGSPDWASVEPL